MTRAPLPHIVTAYQNALDAGQIIPDSSQAAALTALARLERELVVKRPFWKKSNVRGVYLYGPVGRGKTWLMDLFYRSLAMDEKLRRHFHVFMQEEVHAPLAQLKGRQDPLPKIARALARHTRVICFDEFLVEDIADAMLLGTLFEALFAAGVALVATANMAPDGLYRDGLQRERFLPAIAAIKTHCEIVNVAGDVDHRAEHIGSQGLWRMIDGTGKNGDLDPLFRRLTQTEPNAGKLSVNQRPIHFLGATEDTLWARFDALCNGPRNASDYLKLAQRYTTIMIEDIPILDDDSTSAARRFIALVDVLYESRTVLIATAKTLPASLYQGKRYRFEFMRTASRLDEMRSTDWLTTHHLSYARALTPL